MQFSQNLVHIAPNYLIIQHWIVLNNPKYDYASEMQVKNPDTLLRTPGRYRSIRELCIE
jgi:hypothetical protein